MRILCGVLGVIIVLCSVLFYGLTASRDSLVAGIFAAVWGLAGALMLWLALLQSAQPSAAGIAGHPTLTRILLRLVRIVSALLGGYFGFICLLYLFGTIKAVYEGWGDIGLILLTTLYFGAIAAVCGFIAFALIYFAVRGRRVGRAAPSQPAQAGQG